MLEALVECGRDLASLMDNGKQFCEEAEELRNLIRYYFDQLTTKDKDKALLLLWAIIRGRE